MDPFYSFVFFYSSPYVFVVPLALVGLAVATYLFVTRNLGVQLRPLTKPVRLCGVAMLVGPVLAYILFKPSCASLANLIFFWEYALGIVFTTAIAISGNLKYPLRVQFWLAIIQSLILALTLWIGLFPVFALDAISSGLQMSGGARQGC
ncbi:hypothetical protein H3H37_22525 [Duganella sp. LX20W]|uniref:Uncharacterized protein n=1 Tax=Rugamonas brunnea TaxID=2758569 RepID=A0A7W2IE14_9BURK|nr:hypothetical protein [Rugamonas brunnea]MBA5639840.1 hypothetical protein [Rugamonas brunnea]